MQPRDSKSGPCVDCNINTYYRNDANTNYLCYNCYDFYKHPPVMQSNTQKTTSSFLGNGECCICRRNKRTTITNGIDDTGTWFVCAVCYNNEYQKYLGSNTVLIVKFDGIVPETVEDIVVGSVTSFGGTDKFIFNEGPQEKPCSVCSKNNYQRAKKCWWCGLDNPYP